MDLTMESNFKLSQLSCLIREAKGIALVATALFALTACGGSDGDSGGDLGITAPGDGAGGGDTGGGDTGGGDTGGGDTGGGDTGGGDTGGDVPNTGTSQLFPFPTGAAVILPDGSLVAQGESSETAFLFKQLLEEFNGESPVVDVTYSRRMDGFAALREDGVAFVWGRDNRNWNIAGLNDDLNIPLGDFEPYFETDPPFEDDYKRDDIWKLTGVKSISGTRNIAVLHESGHVTVFGQGWKADKVNSWVFPQFMDVESVAPICNDRPDSPQFFGYKKDGSLLAWGFRGIKYDNTYNVTSDAGFPAGVLGDNNPNNNNYDKKRDKDGNLILDTNGEPVYKGDDGELEAMLDGTESPVAYGDAFCVEVKGYNGDGSEFDNFGGAAALRQDGALVTWGGLEPENIAEGDDKPWRTQPSILTSDAGIKEIIDLKRNTVLVMNDGSIELARYLDGFNSEDFDGYTLVDASYHEFKENLFMFRVAKDGKQKVMFYSDLVNGSFDIASDDEIKLIDPYGEYDGMAFVTEGGMAHLFGTASFEAVSSFPLLSNVDRMVTTPQGHAGVALLKDGTVRSWGMASDGGSTSGVAADLAENKIVDIAGGQYSLYALNASGKVIGWGNINGERVPFDALEADGTNPVVSFTTNVNRHNVVALRADGSLIAWGEDFTGGDLSSVANQVDGSGSKVVKVLGSGFGYAALLENGTLLNWGALSCLEVCTDITGNNRFVDIVRVGDHVLAYREDRSTVVLQDDI